MSFKEIKWWRLTRDGEVWEWVVCDVVEEEEEFVVAMDIWQSTNVLMLKYHELTRKFWDVVLASLFHREPCCCTNKHTWMYCNTILLLVVYKINLKPIVILLLQMKSNTMILCLLYLMNLVQPYLLSLLFVYVFVACCYLISGWGCLNNYNHIWVVTNWFHNKIL